MARCRQKYGLSISAYLHSCRVPLAAVCCPRVVCRGTLSPPTPCRHTAKQLRRRLSIYCMPQSSARRFTERGGGAHSTSQVRSGLVCAHQYCAKSPGCNWTCPFAWPCCAAVNGQMQAKVWTEHLSVLAFMQDTSCCSLLPACSLPLHFEFANSL